MDYEKKYKEALERMKSWARGEHPECFAEAQKAAEFIFPELAESEDERIRKLCEILVRTCFMNELCTKEDKDDCIAWLEKQESVGEIVERCKTSWYNEGKIQGQIEGLSDEEKYQQGWHNALERQGEQKAAWSEEDKDFMYDTLSNLTELKDRYGEGYGNVGKCIGWLKSLKQRYTWKPSEEQLDALQYVYRNFTPSPSDELGWNSLKTLELMYHDLKKFEG